MIFMRNYKSRFPSKSEQKELFYLVKKRAPDIISAVHSCIGFDNFCDVAPTILKVLVTEGYDQYFVKEIQTEPTLSYRCSNIYLILAILVVTRTPVIPINVIMAANVPNSGTILICLISLLCPSQ